MDPTTLKNESGAYIPTDVQRILTAAGIRDEHVFPTPIILETKPTLLGYYRLLLGVPQKSFYRSDKPSWMLSYRFGRLLRITLLRNKSERSC
ncbi:MAG: XcyI family restriction endonuclease [Candidatus Binatia bacterium]